MLYNNGIISLVKQTEPPPHNSLNLPRTCSFVLYDIRLHLPIKILLINKWRSIVDDVIIAEYSEFVQTPTQVFKIQQTFCVAFVSKIKIQSQ